ncbi:MAG: JAB domain-containing protein [Deltaproteobacteria bacterium]|nr:JAB domain-containing protein [Deltaproteobacteria bacterium]
MNDESTVTAVDLQAPPGAKAAAGRVPDGIAFGRSSTLGRSSVPGAQRAPVASTLGAPSDWPDDALVALLAGDATAAVPPPHDSDHPPAGIGSTARDPGRIGKLPPSLRADVAHEILRRLRRCRRAPPPPALRCSADAWAQLGPRLARRTREEFFVVALDARNRLLSFHRVALGSLSTCLVHPREVFAPLVRRRAAAALLVHNHPSGDPSPSPEDETLTERLVAAGRLLGIPVLDHLIVARDAYASLRDLGKMGDQSG